ALLGYLGRHIDRLRLPLPRRSRVAPAKVDAAPGQPGGGWLRWSRFVERHRLLAALGGTVILLALAAPFLGVRFGFPDAGNDPAGKSNRQAYDTVARDFGRGRNGPLVLVVTLARPGDNAPVGKLAAEIGHTPGVSVVARPQFNTAQDTAILTVIPTTGPQDVKTEDLVHKLRDDVIPAAMA